MPVGKGSRDRAVWAILSDPFLFAFFSVLKAICNSTFPDLWKHMVGSRVSHSLLYVPWKRVHLAMRCCARRLEHLLSQHALIRRVYGSLWRVCPVGAVLRSVVGPLSCAKSWSWGSGSVEEKKLAGSLEQMPIGIKRAVISSVCEHFAVNILESGVTESAQASPVAHFINTGTGCKADQVSRLGLLAAEYLLCFVLLHLPKHPFYSRKSKILLLLWTQSISTDFWRLLLATSILYHSAITGDTLPLFPPHTVVGINSSRGINLKSQYS